MSKLPPNSVEALVIRFGRERWNEHLKLGAAVFNGLSIASFVGAFVAPFVNAAPPRPWSIAVMVILGVLLHVAAQTVLRYYRGKD